VRRKKEIRIDPPRAKKKNGALERLGALSRARPFRRKKEALGESPKKRKGKGYSRGGGKGKVKRPVSS